MPLYICTKCGVIDNTATGGNYWWEDNKKKVLCCECYTGKWHGLFKKEYFNPKKWTKVGDFLKEIL